VNNVTYQWIGSQSVNCIGIHKSGGKYGGTATTGGQDSFTCTSTDGQPLALITAGETLTQSTWAILGFCWSSDYFFWLNGSTVCATSFSGTVSATGTSFTAVATF
jgi:hypothetical protein